MHCLCFSADWFDRIAVWRETLVHPWEIRIHRLAWLGLLIAAIGLGVRADNVLRYGAAVAVAATVALRPPLHRLPGFWPLAFVGAWTLLSASVNGGSPFAVGRWTPLWIWLLLPTTLCLVASHPRWTVLATTVLTASAVNGVLTVAQSVIGFGQPGFCGISPHGIRFSTCEGVWGHWTLNSLALGLGLLGLLLPQVTWKWRLALGPWLAGGLILCQARTGLVSLALALTVWGLIRPSRWRLLSLTVCALIILGASVVMFRASPERIRNLMAGQDGRRELWSVAVPLVADHPLLGSGGKSGYVQQIGLAWAHQRPEVPFPGFVACHAHNTLLNQALWFGLPAAAGLLFAFLAVGVAAWRRRRGDGDVTVAMLVLLAAGSQFEALWTQGIMVGGGALLLGLALASPRRVPFQNRVDPAGDRDRAASSSTARLAAMP